MPHVRDFQLISYAYNRMVRARATDADWVHISVLTIRNEDNQEGHAVLRETTVRLRRAELATVLDGVLPTDPETTTP